VAKEALKADPWLPVIIGFDCGLTPAATFKQMQLDGRVRTLKEAVAFDMGMKRFAKTRLRPILRTFSQTTHLFLLEILLGNEERIPTNQVLSRC